MRILIAIVAIHNLAFHQTDVIKMTFLNGDLEEEIYIEQLEGYVMKGQEHKVCRLIKSSYTLVVMTKGFKGLREIT